MKITRVLSIAIAVIVSTSAAKAVDWTWDWNERFSYVEEEEKFRAQEFTIDLFGSYSRNSAEEDDFFDEPEHGVWGGGIGANYFFSKFGGVGIEATASDNGGVLVDTASASVIGRFPIEAASMAPYIFGGGGRIFGADEWEGHAGLGLEFRINPHTGIFADGRYIWATDSALDGSQIRAGLRFAF